MQKDFKTWNNLKSQIHHSHKSPQFRELEIWWCSLGTNIGVEEDGKNQSFERPVLIFRKFNNEMFWGLPITSKIKNGKFYFIFKLHNQERSILLSQIRIWSSKRLIRRISKISDKQFHHLNNAFIFLINKTDPLRGPRVPNGNSI
ncbi:MAG: type II toxin-antitoxin system PemK/MazF family toxin [bacterium]|nr:type II toxin-antitoxin system PemK/MazF family toxin [bacterium]